jgi:hypothetical protein
MVAGIDKGPRPLSDKVLARPLSITRRSPFWVSFEIQKKPRNF